MVRKIHLFPRIHDYTMPSIMYMKLDTAQRKFLSEDSKRKLSYLDIIYLSMKDKNVDVIFCEGKLKTWNINLIRNLDRIKKIASPDMQKMLGFAKEEKCRIEKTEDEKDINFHLYLVSLPFYVPFRLRGFVWEIVKKLDIVSMKKRDYNMAKNVSKELKEGETGILLYGMAHHPENYIRMLSPDIEVIIHPYNPDV